MATHGAHILSDFALGFGIFVIMSETDLQLLTRYTRQRAEDAFTEVVRRHVDLVHSAALRQVRSPELAEEVAQAVFIELARRAGQLPADTVVGAWLYNQTRRRAIDVVRREVGRRLREQTAQELQAMNATAEDWTHIEPFLDDAMEALEETDRLAVLLRYFQNKPLREVGQIMGVTDDAAQKRVSRAVDRLRDLLTKRGVAVGGSGLVILISTNAVLLAPTGLSAAIVTTAVSETTFITATTATVGKAIAMTTTQKAVTATILAAAVGLGIYEAHQAATQRADVQRLAQQHAALSNQLADAARERDEAVRQLTILRASVAEANRVPEELLRLRNEVGLLRAQIRTGDSPVEGKTLSEWLQHYDKGQNNLTMQAQNGIRQIGTNAIPELLNLLHTSVSTGETGWRVTCAFRALGPLAKPAVPELIGFLHASESEWIRAQAAASLGFIGREAQAAIPALIAALGDKDYSMRINSIGALSRIGGEPSVLVPVFMASLDDPRADVRIWAATGLGQFGNQAEAAVPKLLEALTKRGTDDDERSLVSFAQGLESIGPTANNVAPALLQLSSYPHEGIRRLATKVLKRLDPEAAARVGVE